MSDRVKVLVVDDVAVSLTAVGELIESSGIAVIPAQSGRDALEALLVHDVALALIDVHMPGMDGFELAELMRGTERTRHIPIIFITGAIGAASRMFEGYEAGAVDFLFKPVDPLLLRSKVATFVELHQQRRLLTAKLSELEDMMRLSEMFVAVLGHDLRSSLQSLTLGANLVEARAGDVGVVRNASRSMQAASRRMTRLVEQLLDFARVRVRGGMPVSPAPCDLIDLVQTCLGKLDSAAGRRVMIEAEGDMEATWDRERMLQVICDLLRNAVQHGAPRAPIQVVIQASGEERVTLFVHNVGTIREDRLATLFEPYAGTAGRTVSEGLGLGLYIAQEIVRAHGGQVSIRSSMDEGTNVMVDLPRHVRA